MGVSAKIVSIHDGRVFTQRILDEFRPGTYCLAMSAETLATLNGFDTDLQELCGRYSTELLVFGCTGATEQCRALSLLTGGAVTGVRALGEQAAHFALSREAMSLSRQLAGLSFPGVPGDATSTFELGNAARDVVVIVAANDCPMFVRMNRGSCQVFLWAGPVPDLEKALSRDHGIEDHYSLLIPPLLFLRHCFGDSCWHATQSTARLIIDDPLLSERYGFLDCGALLKSMQLCRYGTSIAFIPWNYWRTSRTKASRLLGETSNLAICIHGCDHTNREFEVQDPALLDRKAGLAPAEDGMAAEADRGNFRARYGVSSGTFLRGSDSRAPSKQLSSGCEHNLLPHGQRPG